MVEPEVKAAAALDFAMLASLSTSSRFVGTATLFLVPAASVAGVVVVLASGLVYSAEFGSY